MPRRPCDGCGELRPAWRTKPSLSVADRDGGRGPRRRRGLGVSVDGPGRGVPASRRWRFYRHVASKDELLALLADHLSCGAGDARARRRLAFRLEAWTRAQIVGVLARPWFLNSRWPSCPARTGCGG
ncbi:hypothetical protein HBB16_17170 [Pseudonocardia sp. MCCB 268]|nr:hypothetical protein [Pseudonocardia cytotoxica]